VERKKGTLDVAEESLTAARADPPAEGWDDYIEGDEEAVLTGIDGGIVSFGGWPR
jgi:hypothetical protein